MDPAQHEGCKREIDSLRRRIALLEAALVLIELGEEPWYPGSLATREQLRTIAREALEENRK